MSTNKQSKINQLLQMQPSGVLYFGAWMLGQGFSYELQRKYRDSFWLTSIGEGVMIRTGEKPTIHSALSCYNEQLARYE